MNIGLPQIIWILLMAFNIGVTVVKHGEPQPNYNIWTTIIGVALSFGLLLWGGFFG